MKRLLQKWGLISRPKFTFSQEWWDSQKESIYKAMEHDYLLHSRYDYAYEAGRYTATNCILPILFELGEGEYADYDIELGESLINLLPEKGWNLLNECLSELKKKGVK